MTSGGVLEVWGEDGAAMPEIPFSEMVTKTKGAKVMCNGRETGGVTLLNKVED